jgi:hypothetical protein
VSDDGSLEVLFTSPEGSPFESTEQDRSEDRHEVRASPFRRDLQKGKRYPYEVVLKQGAKVLGRAEGSITIEGEGSAVVEGTAPAVRSRVRISLQGSEIIVDEPRARVDRRKAEQVEWSCPDGLCVIHFNKDGSPFEFVMMAGEAGKPIRSGSCNPCAGVRPYHYSIWVWPRNGGPPVYRDPIVDVEDGGDPGT